MKKLIIMLVFFASSLIAMETFELVKITTEDSQHFIKHFGWAISACKRKVAEKVYSEQNSMCAILCKLSDDLAKHNDEDTGIKDIKKMMTVDQDLTNRINTYRALDCNPVIQRALDQVRNNQGDVKKAKDLVIQTRRVLAELKLQELQPTYSLSLIGEIDTKERENFMHRNANYPLDNEAVKNYTALFIYLTLLADKVE